MDRKRQLFNRLFGTKITDEIQEIYVYCFGAVAKACFYFWENSDLRISKFIVSDARNVQQEYYGIPVVGLNEVKDISKPVLIATFNNKYITEIEEGLKNYNAAVFRMEIPENSNVDTKEWESFFDEIKFYRKLEDKESKLIYRNRLAFSMWGEIRCIKNMIKNSRVRDPYVNDEYRNLLQFIQMDNTEREIRFVLAGVYSELIIERIPELGYPIDGYISDTYDVENKLSVPVFSIDEYKKNLSEDYILVYDNTVPSDICDALISKGISKDKIVMTCNSGCGIEYGYPMYFDKIFQPRQQGVFVDGGCFNGGTIVDFQKWNPDYKAIFSFEPEPAQYENCSKKFHDERVHILNYAVWNKREKLRFQQNGAGSWVNDEADLEVEGISIDEVVGDAKVTFIKLDVEGSELKAIEGARETIKKYRPDLAISAYHRAYDLLDLPDIILKICPDYRIYLRHYQISKYETVLLATCDKGID